MILDIPQQKESIFMLCFCSCLTVWDRVILISLILFLPGGWIDAYVVWLEMDTQSKMYVFLPLFPPK